jgi:hypothetical protein
MQQYTLEQLACFFSHFMDVFYSPGAGDPSHSRLVGSNSLITILVLKDQYYFAPPHVSASRLSCITPKAGGTPIKPIGCKER